MLKLSTPDFTKLSRFLAPDAKATTIAFGTIQKTFASLDTEIRQLSKPVSIDFLPLAGNLEDHGTNAPYVVTRIAEMVDNLYYILGMELLHAAQAVDLRRRKFPMLRLLGNNTRALHEAFRKEVSFLKQDRTLTTDIKKAYEFVKYGRALRVLPKKTS